MSVCELLFFFCVRERERVWYGIMDMCIHGAARHGTAISDRFGLGCLHRTTFFVRFS